MPNERIPVGASMMALGAGAVWSLGAILAKLSDRADAFQYLIWRSVGIIVVIEVMARMRHKPSQTLRAYRSGRLMLLTHVMLLMASLGFVYAVKTTSPANAAFLGSTTPVFGAILARVILRERMTWVTICSILVAFVGLFVMVAGDLKAGSMVGNLSALAAAIGFAGYTVCVRSNPAQDWSPVMPGYGALMIVICTVVTLASGKALVPPAGDMALALLHGGLIIVAGTYLFNVASRQVPAAAMTVFAQTEMVLVPIWAFLALGDRPKATTLIGGSIIFVAIIGKALIDSRSTDQRPVLDATMV